MNLGLPRWSHSCGLWTPTESLSLVWSGKDLLMGVRSLRAPSGRSKNSVLAKFPKPQNHRRGFVNHNANPSLPRWGWCLHCHWLWNSYLSCHWHALHDVCLPDASRSYARYVLVILTWYLVGKHQTRLGKGGQFGSQDSQGRGLWNCLEAVEDITSISNDKCALHLLHDKNSWGFRCR